MVDQVSGCFCEITDGLANKTLYIVRSEDDIIYRVRSAWV